MRTKYLVIGTLVLLVAVLFAVPSVQAKSKLADDEMDLVTAAGQPTIMQVGDGGTISFSGGPTFNLTLDSNSQNLLTALTLNNIVGESQIANALNVVGNATNGGEQTNKIQQSWGSTYDFTAVTVSAASATASAHSSDSGAAAGTQAVCGQSFDPVTAKCGYVANHGSATAYAAAAASTSTSVVSGAFALVSAYADQIFLGGDGASITVNEDGASNLTILSTAQQSLAALVVNNIVGQAQIANGTNIMGSSIVYGPASGNVLLLGGVAGLLPGTSQSNDIQQCRGTPCTRPTAFSTPVATSTSSASASGFTAVVK